MANNLTLPNGQVISSQDPNYADYVKQYGSPSGDTNTVDTNPVLTEAQKEANTMLGSDSGLVSPMSLADIKSQEASRVESAKSSNIATYQPQIDQAKISGERAVGAAEGQLAGGGIGAGSAAGSAQIAYLAATQTDVDNRVAEIQKQQDAALQKGLLDIYDKSQASIDKLNEYSNNLIMKRADLAMSIVSQKQNQEQIDISKQSAEASQEIAKKQLSLSIAESLGYFDDGTPTFQAKQAQIENAYKKADLTGIMSDGTKTLAAKTAALDYALKQEGIQIDKAQLAETIRSNKANEGMSAARLAYEKSQANKKSGELTPQEKALQTDLSKSISAISQDPANWGPEWSYIKNTYFPDSPTDTADKKLQKAKAVDDLLQKDAVIAKQKGDNSKNKIDLVAGAKDVFKKTIVGSLWNTISSGFNSNTK